MKIMKLMIGMILLMAIMPGVLAAVPISTCQDLQNMQINLAGEYYLTQDIDCSNTSTWNSGAGFMPVGNESSEFTGTFDGQGHIVGNLYINRPSTYNVGLFGWTLYAEIKNIGVENVTINGHFNVGGLVGDNGGPVSNSYSTGIVNGLGSSVGGLVGVNAAYSNSQVSNSYSTASVNANDDFGGLVGYNDGTISNSYSTGSVNRVGECGAGGCDAGGLLGWNNLGTTSDSFWDIQTSGQASSAGGTGKTTAEMKQNATFSGWDFADIWRIAEGMTSPQLRWQRIAISTCQDLQNMQINLAGEYYLANDVNCTDTINWNSGAGFMPVNYCSDAVCWTNAPFTGKFDGQNHTISNLYINRPSRAYVGLFGYTLNSEIKNVGLIDVNIHGYFAVGGLAGNNYIGGTITNCYSTGSVSGDINVGGLAGYIGGNISSSYSTASVSGSGGDYGTGGLVGQSSNYATITNSYSTGSVSGNNDVGGLIGAGYGPITNSYSTGSVSGNNDVGGLVGVNEGGGWDHFGPILNSFWDMQTSGQSSSKGGEGKTTAEMKQQSTFSGWDFTNVWNINEGITYPYLRWQTPAMQDADSDGVEDSLDNCVNDYNPDQSNIDGTDGGDVCDNCPACSGTCCIEEYSSAESVNSSGATITIQSDSVLDIPANALANDKSISITKGTGSNFKICMPESGECGITVSTYTIGPTGQTFNNDYTLKLSYGSQEECSWGACEIWYSDDEGATWSNPWGPPAIENGFLVISANHFTEFAIVVVNKTYVQNVTIALDASDPTSGIADTGYCIDSVNECTPDTIYSAPFLVEGIGMHYIRYQSYDNAGNVELIKIMRVNIIESCDSSPPIIEILTEGVMGNNNWFVSIVNWTIRAIDNISGMKTLDYSIEKQ